MLDALIVVNLVISKEIARLTNSELKISDTLTLDNMVYIEKNKQDLVSMSHKGFKNIVMKRANIGLRIVSSRET